MRKFFLLAAMIVMNLGWMSHAQASRYYAPKWNGYALDWCRDFETGCGKPAADLYCQKRGSPYSMGFVQQPQVPYQTMVIGDNAICNPAVHRCDSFSYIDCAETVRTFPYPTYNGYRLDWCREFEQDCGAPAALRFCQANGFSQLVNFAKQGGLSVPTMVEGSNAICNPQYHSCDSFSFIECKN